MSSIVNDRRGVGWVLGVAILSILIMPIVYYPLSLVWDRLYYMIIGDYVFTGVFVNALAVVNVILNYLVIFGLFFTVAWAIIQAKKTRYEA